MHKQCHEAVVQRQFDDQANAYLHSAVHAHDEEFSALREAVANARDARVLDLGCGAGHVSFQIAEFCEDVVAYDLSEPMLDMVTRAAAERGLSNVRTWHGAAERLPFADGAFDFVFSRYSAHHWQDVGRALRGVQRVLAPGGSACFIDVAAPGTPLLDTHLQTVELLRDSSHVRDYSPAEWLRLAGEAGLQVERLQRRRLRLEFTSWVQRMRTPVVMCEAIRALQQAVAKEVREYFEIAEDGSFSTDVIVLWAGRG